ncbi:MAG: hypothetical protein ACRDGT_09475 [Candidatus Limnocylindria bacterium]
MFAGQVFYPYLYDALIAVGYGLILPVIAVMHVRHAPVRQSGTVLGTIAGIATVTAGLGGSVNVDLRPAALFVLGIWWWTIGKMWVETRALPRALGFVTATLAVLVLIGAFLESAGVLAAVIPGFPEVDVWTLGRVALGGWLVAIALVLFGPWGSEGA